MVKECLPPAEPVRSLEIGDPVTQNAAVMTPTAAWLFLICFYLLPIAHVLVSAKGGPWRMPPGARCPFSPRVGWLVIVVTLGALGWLLYLRGRGRRPAA